MADLSLRSAGKRFGDQVAVGGFDLDSDLYRRGPHG